jgi:putative ABC transport system permease protein
MSAPVKPNLLRPRWRKVFSDLWNDKVRTALVVASIAAGVFAVGMIMSAYAILDQDVNRNYEAINAPNIVIQTDPFDKDLVDVVGKLPGVKQAQGRRTLSVRARRGQGGWEDLTLVGVTGFPVPISRLTAIEGAPNAGTNQTVITQDPLHVTGFHTGDAIEVELPNNGGTHTLTVVGLVSDQTTSRPEPNVNNFAYVTMKTMDDLGQGDYFNQLYATVQGDGGNHEIISVVAARVQDKIERGDRQVYRLDEYLSTEHPMADLTLAVLGMLAALGGLITILSSSLIINTLSAMLAQQLRQIGVMKLVGSRTHQILGMYLTLITIYGVIALALAAPAGALAGYGVASFIAALTGAVLGGFRVIPLAILVQALIAILVPLGAGLFPVLSGAKTSVQHAISDFRPAERAGRNDFMIRGGRWFRWISRPTLLSIRNTFRKQGRLALTLFTLTVAGAVFIAVFNVRDSLDSMLQQLLQHFSGDVTVDLGRPYRVAEVRQSLMEIPGVRGVEAWTGAAGEIWDGSDKLVTNVSIVAPPQDTQLLHIDLRAGRWLLPGEQNAIVVADSIYNYYPNLKPGDSLRIKIPGRHVQEWKVVGVFPFLALFGDPLAYANYDFIAEQNFMPNQATSFRIVSDAHDAASQEALTPRIAAHLDQLGYPVQNVQTGHGMREKAALALDILLVFLLIMAFLTAFVGSIGLMGAMSISVLERTREIGVMRTIGAVDRVVMQTVTTEALLIGLITWALAIALSFPISYLLLEIMGNAILGSPMALHFTPLGLLLWLGVVALLSVFASIVPARNAARLTINEVLAYE